MNDQVAKGKITETLLKKGSLGQRMYYSPNLDSAGAVNPPGWIRKNGKIVRAKPAFVRIGTNAFHFGVPFLYSTMMHEYRHVLQFQERSSNRTLAPGQNARTPEQTNQLILRQEVEAYSWELVHSKRTGLFKDPVLMGDRWRNAVAKRKAWPQMFRGRPRLRAFYLRARRMVIRSQREN
jgi:hypothetical protein